jgi:hypothetical protein
MLHVRITPCRGLSRPIVQSLPHDNSHLVGRSSGYTFATTWRLTIDDLNVNLSALSEIQFGIDYVAFRA